MCGLFGALHCGDADGVGAVAAVVAALGILSEERGRDASGVAIITPGSVNKEPATAEQASTQVLQEDGLTLVKDAGSFTDLLPRLSEHLLAPGSVFIGHTRWATQGDAKALINASPMLAGHLVGTHNGDVEVSSVPDSKRISHEVVGGTDTEVLYRALDTARRDRRKLTKVLRSIRGRAALAFIDREDTSRLFLARAALSPLSIAYDTAGNLYWASNPDWFRTVSKQIGVEFVSITLVPEGHLLTVDTLTGEIADVRRFTPTCRESDLALIDTAVHRNFHSGDRATDRTLMRHQVATRLPDWKTLTEVPVTRETPAASTPATTKGKHGTKGGGKSRQEVLFSSSTARPAAGKGSAWADAVAEDDPWARYDDPPAEYFDGSDGGPVDMDEVEELCWDGNEFDLVTYHSILDADPDRARELLDDLRAERADGLGRRAG